MINIVNNIDNLKDSDINNIVVRVKALIINSKKEILLGHSHLEYQFPGGHVEGNEDLHLALKRELKEELGLEYDTFSLEPIGINTAYHKNYPNEGTNTKTIIYYYEIFDDRIPNLTNTNYTEEELDGKYTLRYIPLDIVEDVLKRNIVRCGDASGISQEMLEIFKNYLN